MPLYASDFDQSRFLRAADLGEISSEKRLKMKTVTKEIDVGENKETKPCVWFTTTDKGLLLNKTNLRVLQSAFGNDMLLWANKIVVVYSTMADFRGKMVPALRVRIPPPKDSYRAAPKPAPKQQVVDDEDDEVDRFNETVHDTEIADVDE
jgi:hypothetical protein